MTHLEPEPTPRARRLSRVCLAIMMVTLAGCGAELYEHRLAQTQLYFEYIDLVNRNLGAPWQSQGVEARLPHEFRLIPPPPPKPEEEPAAEGEEAEESTTGEAEAEEPIDDPRQPDYVNLELPGLVGAWTAQVPVEVEGKIERRPAYLYILTNGVYWSAGKNDEAIGFHTTVAERLGNALDTYLEESAWSSVKFPKGQGFVEPKAYTAAEVRPQQPVDLTPDDTSYDEIPIDVRVWLAQAGDIQGVILLVVPRNLDPQFKLAERIDLFLENLKISPQKPAPTKPGSAAPAGPGPTF